MNNKLIMVVITLVVGVILAGSLLAPVITDAQKDAGEATTLNNDVLNGVYYKKWAGEDFTAVYSTENLGHIILNGEDFTFNYKQMILIASDVFSARSGGIEGYAQCHCQILNETAQHTNTSFSFSVSNGSYTLTVGDSTTSGTISWLWLISPTETEYGGLRTIDSSWYSTNPADSLILGNIYLTGENDTYYAYYNGELTVNDEYADKASISFNSAIVEGTTDIYESTVTVTIDEESFTPYFQIVPISTTGHVAGGAVYSLYGVLPIMVIVALLVCAIQVIRPKDN